MLTTRLLFVLLFLSFAIKSEKVNAATSISKMSTLTAGHYETIVFTGKNVSFFEKMALKTVERKLRKTRQRAAEMQGDTTRPCGKIVLVNGDTIAAELSELNRTQVKYRRCGYPDDPVFTLERADVLIVLASNGDALHNNQKIVNSNKKISVTKPSKKDSSLAIVSFIFSILALLTALSIAAAGIPLALVGLISGGIAFIRVTSEPKQYGGKVLSLTSVLVCSLVMLLIFL